MLPKILREISRPHWVDILYEIKRTGGMSVGEIAERLSMSYMGVKQHCVAMEKLGYLVTWRSPQSVGRPQKLYRLTERIQPLFPEASGDFALDLLQALDETHGEKSAEKLLFSFFRMKAEAYRKKLKGKSVLEKASSFASQREKEGYLSLCHFENEEGLTITEFHNPHWRIAKAFPAFHRMEETMFENVLGEKVEREEVQNGPQKHARFHVATLH
ncbi:MAG: winged helix-turn-helix transcriptional regulator [Verrucomicrobiota bacterium]